MHPCLQYFGNKSPTACFPLVLVVGREPNCAQPVVAGDGPYDFRESPRCGFWNASYQLAARLSSANTASGLKRICETKNASPIVYADALPVGLLSNCLNKAKHRRGVSDEAISRHAESIASQTEWMRRVRLVLFSGLHADFSRSVKALTQRLQHIAPICTVPFFANQNAKQLLRRIHDDYAASRQLTSIVEEFIGMSSIVPTRGGVA